MQETQDTVQTVQGTNVQSTHTTTTVATISKEEQHSKDVNSAIEVTGISMAAIFGFMFVFYLVIKGIDILFPFKKEE